MRPNIPANTKGLSHDTDQSKDLRLVLIGKTGSGKSACGNTILGKKVFESGLNLSSITKTCRQETVDLAEEHNGPRTVAVVDTPGFGDTGLTMDEVHTEIAKCAALSAPGPHAFLLVVPLGRYTEDEDRAVDQLTQIFEEEAVRPHTMVLFTRGDELEGKAVEDVLQKAPTKLHALIKRCGGRYHVFNNKDARGSVQVKELISKVEEMAKQTATGFYTNELYKVAAATVREEQERQLRSSGSSSRQSWLDAALSPKVLKIIKTMVAALAAGAAVGMVVGLTVPVASAIGASLVGHSVGVAANLLAGNAAAAAAGTAVGAFVTSVTSTTALGVGAAAGAVLGGAVGAVAAIEADSPSVAVQNTVEQVVQVGGAAVGVAVVVGGVLGAGVAISAASGVAAGAAKVTAQSGAAAVMQSTADVAQATSSAATVVPGIGTAAAAAAAAAVGGVPVFKYQKLKTTRGEGPGASTTEETVFELLSNK